MGLVNNRGSDYSDLNKYCAIREYWKKDSKKVLIALWSLIHRTKFSFWDLPNIVIDKFWWKFVWIDYPKKEYNSDLVIKQIVQYIQDCWADEIVLCGLSFWEIVVNDILKVLPWELKSKIKLHISICWVWNRDDLTLPTSVDVTKNISNKLMKCLTGSIWLIDRSKIPLLKNFLSKWMVDYSGSVSQWKLERHKKVASLWLTPGIWDRLVRILNQKGVIEKWYKNISTIALYSTNDSFFKDPKSAAEHVAETDSPQIFEIVNWWHAWLLEMPDIWNPALEKVLSQCRNRVDS